MLAICKPKMNDCRWLYPFQIKLAVPLQYPGCLPLLRKVQMYFRAVPPPPLAKRLQLDPESTVRIRSAPWILTVTVGVPWSWVTGTVTKLLTALAGNLRWKLLSWFPSVTSFPDDRCFDEQLQHKCCLTFPFFVIWNTHSFPRSFWWKIYLKNILWQSVVVSHT